MLLTPHILVGVAIITLIQNPILGLFLVFLSHYFLDIIPHTEYTIQNIKTRQWSKSLPDFLKVFSDIILGLVIIFLIIGYSPLILAAAFVAILPDGLTMLRYIFPVNKLLKKHLKIHTAIHTIYENKKLPSFLGIMSQVIVMAIAIYFLR